MSDGGGSAAANPLILQYSDGKLVPYQTPDPGTAAQRALDFTGIPDIASGINALARGEYLPGLGQAASGAAGMLPLGKLAGAAKLGAELMPLAGMVKAWHGTPHLFEPVEHNPFGEFRDAAIGTGEGAQAYGHGHYVAGNPAVAEEYQRNLAGRGSIPADGNGNPLSDIAVVRKFYEPGTIVPGYGGDFDRVIKFNEPPETSKYGGGWSVDVRRVVPDVDKMKSEPGFQYSSNELHNRPDLWKDVTDHTGNIRNHSTFPVQRELQIMGERKGWPMTQPGNLLEVHILPDEHELLDWDKPLAAQPEGVRKVIDGIHAENEDLRIKHSGPGVTGENFYRNLANQFWDKTYAGIGGGSEAASKALHEAGIPGIKYLDQGSRARGAGTSNYVIFDPKNLRIVGRNGQRLEPVEEDPFK